MADPIREQISQEILATLQGITTTSGYNQTLTVARHNPLGDPPQNNYAYIYEGDDTEAEPHRVTGKERWVAPYAVAVHVIPTSGTVDQLINTVAADVHKCIMADANRTNGSGTRLAEDTAWVRAERFTNENDQLAGVICYFDVTYRHKDNDPFTL